VKVTILCSDAAHPVNEYLSAWAETVSDRHEVLIARTVGELTRGDFLFLVSCSELIKAAHRERYGHTLVLHASDLPKGRGWSPHIWEIVEGGSSVTLSLLEAEDEVDSGRIWLKRQLPINKTMLWDEVNHLLFKVEIELIDYAILNHENIKPYMQDQGVVPSYRRKRTLEDSEIDPQLSICDQFNLIRMCDPKRYPAWFEIYGQRYKLVVTRTDDE
jgi:methionyl-tRNA formyltransferase